MPRKRFLELIATVLPAVASKGPGVTSGIHLSADDFGRVVATATDYGFTISAWAEAEEVRQTGAIVLPGALLAKILATLPDAATVTLAASTEGGKGGGVITAGMARFELGGRLAEEFPADELEGIDDAGRLELPRVSLATGLRSTAPFVSDDSSRPALCNVSLAIHKDTIGGLRLTMAGTDGHRLGYFETALDAGATRPGHWLIPAAMAKAIAAALASSEDPPWIATNGRNLCAVVGRTSIRARACDESFPDWRRVRPDVAPHAVVTVERGQLRESVRRCLAMSPRDKDGLALVTLEVGGPEGITVSAYSIDMGRASDTVGLFSTRRDGKTLKFGVNAGYLIAALDVFGGEQVQVQATDGFDPILITCDTEIGPGQVIMPMRF